MWIRDYTVMLVGDERSPVRRFHVPKQKIQRIAWIAGVVALIGVVGFWDYWRLRADNSELAELRIEAAEQREQIRVFEATLEKAEVDLTRVQELERKVRIIANLPGAASAGGTDVVEVVPAGAEETEAGPLTLPAGVPIDPEAPPAPALEPQARAEEPDEADSDLVAKGRATGGAQLLIAMDETAIELGGTARTRAGSLEELVTQLEDKRTRLSAMPSVWPTKGWLTSRYGHRISPFTGRRHHHSGIDIAARSGTPVISPANGRVKFVGRKGPLGNTVIIDHGFGVRTVYGHNSDIHVDTGDEVIRGQQIASIGSTGRSTGPHLHYSVQVKGKHQDPLNYILD